MNRYYSSTLARFTTPDPYRASGGPADPQSWNRYAYVQNDPVNANDPEGLAIHRLICPPGTTMSLGATCVPYGGGSATWWLPPPSTGYVPPPHLVGETVDQLPAGFVAARLARRFLQGAVDTAVDALLRDDCASLFGGANPIAVLYELQRGDTSWGTIRFADLGGPNAQGQVNSATTTGILGRTPEGASMFSGVTITINTSSGAPWSGGYPDRFGIGNATSPATQEIYRAMTLIHELGHAFNTITGLGSSQIQQDIEDPALSQANTRLVYEKCFR